MPIDSSCSLFSGVPPSSKERSSSNICRPVKHSLHDDGLIRNATHNDLPRAATILLQQFSFDIEYADAELAYSHLCRNVEAFKGKEKPDVTLDSVLAFCADVSKVDDILELAVRVLTVAARKSRTQDRKRGRGYREFNVSARNDDHEGENLAVGESSTAALSDQVVEAIMSRPETRGTLRSAQQHQQQVQKIRDETEKFRQQRQSCGVHAQQVIGDETLEGLEEDEEAIYNTAAQPPRGMPFHRRDTRPPAPSSRNAGRPPLRSESRNLADFKPNNPWEELPVSVRAELKRRGIKSGDDPRYLDKTLPCVACGRETHPVGWCPYIWLQMPCSRKTQEWVQRGQTQMIWPPTKGEQDTHQLRPGVGTRGRRLRG
eukprot:5311787-Pleurochrysis_carterae.AAC.1